MTTNQEILSQLLAAKEENPGLAEVVDLQHDLIEATMQVQISPVQTDLDAEGAHAYLSKGVPLLHPHEVALDWEAFTALYRQVCRIAARHRPDLSAQFDELLSMLEEDPERVKALVTTYVQQGSLETREQGTEKQVELLTFTLNHALRPFLQAYAGALTPLVDQGRWQRGTCPVCGGAPDLAFLEKEAGARYLICSRCDSQWLYPRVRCPFCNTREPEKISYYPQGEKYRVYVCRECQRYLKTLDLRQTEHPVLFAVERVTTVGLDLVAREEGYR